MARKTLKALQEECDILKWESSYSNNKDMSGHMKYCGFCKHRAQGGCSIEHLDRLNKSICGRAFRKMQEQEEMANVTE